MKLEPPRTATTNTENKMAHKIDIRVGEIIKEERRAQGMTQTQLAKKCGVRMQQIAKYESAENRISVSRFCMIAKALRIRPAKLLQEATYGRW